MVPLQQVWFSQCRFHLLALQNTNVFECLPIKIKCVDSLVKWGPVWPSRAHRIKSALPWNNKCPCRSSDEDPTDFGSFKIFYFIFYFLNKKAARKMCCLFYSQDKTQSPSMSIVSLTNSTVNTDRDREVTPPPLLWPANSLSCIDSVSLGRAGVSEKVNSAVTLQVRPVWERSGEGGPCDSEGSRRARTSPRVPLQKEGGEINLWQEFCPLASGPHSWPRRSWLNIAHRFSSFCAPENQDSNLMLPPLNPWQGRRQSKLITTQTLYSHPPCVRVEEEEEEEALIKTSRQSLTNMSKKTQSKHW